MGILATAADERVADVRFDADRLIVDLMDGRTIAAPLAWYPRLLDATPEPPAADASWPTASPSRSTPTSASRCFIRRWTVEAVPPGSEAITTLERSSSEYRICQIC